MVNDICFPRAGRRYLKFADLPAGATVEVKFGDSVYFPTVVNGDEYWVLVAGPDVTQGSAVYVLTESEQVFLRVTVGNEIIPVYAGNVKLVEVG